ncbi:MAG: ATP-binding protein [Chloroflexota bacterium]
MARAIKDRLQPVGRLVAARRWPLAWPAVAALLIHLFYLLVYLRQVPYPGVEYTPIDESNAWSFDLGAGEILIQQIGDLSFAEYRDDPHSVPFAGFQAGDRVPLCPVSGDCIELEMKEPTLGEVVKRQVAPMVGFFPFWIAGTIVLLFVQPRDLRWRLLVYFYYLTAVWTTMGIVSESAVAYSRLALRAVAWILTPLYLDFHLTIPSPLLAPLLQRLRRPVYGAAAALALLQLFLLPPDSLPLTAMALAIVSSFIILVRRWRGRLGSPSDRLPVRLMLMGIALAFGPSIILLLLPAAQVAPPMVVLFTGVAAIALPILPLFYLYAIYKRQLGAMEFRANRVLSLYSFILLYPPLFVALRLLSDRLILSEEGDILVELVLSITFVMATPTLYAGYRRWVDRLVYGTEHDAEDIVRAFANQIPASLNREALIGLLTSQIAPSLLIRQSALYLYEDHTVLPLYTQSLTTEDTEAVPAALADLLTQAGKYRPPHSPGALAWVRLVIPLVSRDQTMGVWLFGRRDPDDFYPRQDIHLLLTLANQIAPAIEDVRLYETLQRQADQLADQVAQRTVELRAERDRTQAILDGAGEGIFYLDPAGLILYANPMMVEITGFQADSLLGETPRLWLGQRPADRTFEEMWFSVQKGQKWQGELAFGRPDGSLYDAHFTIAPCHEPGGHLTGFVGILSDISRLKEVDRLKGQFIANVSHELRTPLTNIKTYHVLLARGRPEKLPQYLLVLEKETERLARLIEDLLQFARLDGRAALAKQIPTEVSGLITEVVNSFEAKAEDKEIELRMQLPRHLPKVMGDAHQLDQVITNLLGNALAYTPEGGRVVVSAGVGEGQRSSQVWLRVADTGLGVHPQEVPHLFDRFYRGKAAEESGAPGTGLGLAICREIVDRHNGRIEVTSREGGGTIFTVWLPAVEPGANGREPHQAQFV